MDKQNLIAECKQRLPVIFKQILTVWKDSPTSNSWALEKLTEVFCKDIAHNMELVEEVSFISFLNGFLEDGNLVDYPDFVMNNVSYMASEVLSSCDDCISLEEPAFFIIRSPLHYWMVSKGHRVDVTFQIYRKWVQQRRLLHLLDRVQFDVTHALVHCMASPYNYTRKSAVDYIVEVVKFAHDVSPEEAAEGIIHDIKSRLRSMFHQLICHFHTTFIKSVDVVLQSRSDDAKGSISQQDKSFTCCQEAVVSYCRLLGDCAIASSCWCKKLAESDKMFDELIMLLQGIISDSGVDDSRLLKSSTVMLMRLIDCSFNTQEKVKKLIKFLIHVTEIPKYACSCDVVYMAGLILTKYKSQTPDHMLLVELSLLPLFILFDVTPRSVMDICPAAIKTTKSFFKSEQKLTFAGLLSAAVDNLSSMKQVTETYYDSFIDYLELSRIDAPAEVGLPIMNGNSIRSDAVLNFLVLKLSRISLELSQTVTEKCHLESAQSYSLLDNIQTYTKACLSYRGISCGQLSVILDCYLAVLKCLKDMVAFRKRGDMNAAEETSGVYNREVLQVVLQGLQLKMLDLDSNARELAVKTVGNLFSIVCSDSSWPEITPELSGSLSSLWQCVESKTEGVAAEVLEVLLKAAMAGQLKLLFHLMNITELDVLSKIDHFLLACPWDNIKPVAFNLLTKVCPDDALVRYAEACLRQDNVRLSVAVLDFIQDLFCSQQEQNSTLEQKVDKVISLLVQGWGDLILHKTNASDICCFRKSSSIMVEVLAFLERADVSAVISKRVSDFCLTNGIALEKYCSGSHSLFTEVCSEILRIHGHLCTTYEKLTPSQPSAAQNSVISETPDTKSCSHQQQTCKRKNSDVMIGDTNKKQRFEPSEKGGHGISSHCLFCTLSKAGKVSPFLRLDQHDRDNSGNVCDREQVLSGGDESYLNLAKRKPVSADDVEVYVDSTKEMPALRLSAQPCSSRQVIQEQLLCGNRFSDPALVTDATGLLSWYVFKEMLCKIDPDSLQQEAQRSTDEYERNSLSVLHDLDKVLSRSLCFLREELERELVIHFFSSFSRFLNTALKTANVMAQGKILKDISSEIYLMNLVQLEEDHVLRFILQRRRSVWKTPLESTESVLNYFLERLSSVRHQGSRSFTKEYFGSSDGLNTLLDLFKDEHIENSKMAQTSLSKDLTNSNDSDFDRMATVRSVTDFILSVCGGGVSEPEVRQTLLGLAQGEIYFLKQTLTRGLDDWETTQSSLKKILNSNWREAFQPVLQLLETLAKQLVLIMYDQNDEVRSQRSSNVGACFSQLEDWYSGKDDFDSDDDDDPTALDCF